MKTNPEKSEAPASNPPPLCQRCDGTGNICNTCGEAEPVCECEEGKVSIREIVICPDCGGTGK